MGNLRNKHRSKRNKRSKAKQDFYKKKSEIPDSPTDLNIKKMVEEYEEIERHELTIEKVTEEPKMFGYRLVDINFILKWALKLQYDHSKKCTTGMLEFIKEERSGFKSAFHYKCNICNEYIVRENEDPSKPSCNLAAVWGTLSTGSTFAHLEEQMSCLDIPCMSRTMFGHLEQEIFKNCTEFSWKNMKQAAEEEKAYAIENQQVGVDGVPWITVYADGGWSKRSYGHNYNAASGVAVVIGKRTGKVLYLGVRNKFCCICARYEHLQDTVKEHKCFVNWNGSSSAMEADIISEAFSRSIELFGIKFKKLISDADSSVYAKILKEVSYGSEVVKVDCSNHSIKNYGKKLFLIKNDTKGVSLAARQLLTKNKIKDLQSTAYKIIYANANSEVQNLIDDLVNSPQHAFGYHLHCNQRYCDLAGTDTDKENLDKLRSSGLYRHIQGAINLMIRRAKYLVDNETSNRAELFMSILNRFNMGKRLNLIQRGSYQGRAFMTLLRYNKGVSWHGSPWKQLTLHSPGYFFSRFINKQAERQKCRKRLFEDGVNKQSKKRKPAVYPNRDYGEMAEQLELDEEFVAAETERLIETLRVSKEEKQNLAKATTGQFENPLYRTERQFRLTASNFGSVVRRQKHTSCHVLVKSILTPSNFTNTALEYGKIKESVAIARLEDELKIKVDPTGLHVDETYPFLGASPDGIVGEEYIVEVKSFYNVSKANINIEAATKSIKGFCLENVNGIIGLKKSHKYYYQIQGQLNITGIPTCIFVGFVNDLTEMHIEYIKKDSIFWEEQMLPKLIKFYKTCLGPEIIRGRLKRKLKCIDPPHIKEAQDEYESRKRKRSKS